MPLPKSVKDFNPYADYYFFRKCVRCDCKRKHQLYLNTYYAERFVEDDHEGITRTEYFEEVSIWCCKCRYKNKNTVCGLKYFTDNVLINIKEENKMSNKRSK
ncbi:MULTISPECIES: hypothetical protein [Pectobacteriaceae]|uniref:hypothetical protein n=1 Tax=Pectobacteriaceae TaxID=1903410 RepID=UPI000DAB3580|nr:MULTISPECIES: hypothetical protein [Pectobacteriaceae]GBO50538.1 hypothetical protein MFFDBJGM_03567 [Pectobacterium versatile]